MGSSVELLGPARVHGLRLMIGDKVRIRYEYRCRFTKLVRKLYYAHNFVTTRQLVACSQSIRMRRLDHADPYCLSKTNMNATAFWGGRTSVRASGQVAHINFKLLPCAQEAAVSTRQNLQSWGIIIGHPSQRIHLNVTVIFHTAEPFPLPFQRE